MEKLIFDTSVNKVQVEQKYEILKLVPETDPILFRQMPKYVFTDAVKLDKLLGDLMTTVKHYKAFGLAANQCGIETSIITVGYGEMYFCLINPEIIYESEETEIQPEGCLSYPGMVISIERPKHIIVKYQNSIGEWKEDNFSSLTARCIRHEIDHINGKTFISRAKPLALKNALKKREKTFKKYARQVVRVKNEETSTNN